MKSWVFLFSKFTPEALLIEALLLFLLVCAYSAYWILKKRRWGAVGETTALTEPVKGYLDHLIGEAEHLRIQLYGLDSSGRSAPKPIISVPSIPLSSLSAIVGEIPLSNSTANLDHIKKLEEALAEKAILQQELQQLRAGGSKDKQDTATEYQATIAKLEQKVNELEGRLNEYSIIEDDLANLKRFQQENNRLKELLNQHKISFSGGTPPVSSPQPSEPAIAAAIEAAPPNQQPPLVAVESAPNAKELASEFENMFKV